MDHQAHMTTVAANGAVVRVAEAGTVLGADNATASALVANSSKSEPLESVHGP
jgi:hypothetical protein